MSTSPRVDEGSASIEDLIGLWTGEQPGPACWIDTAGISLARREIEAALRARVPAVLLTGPSGHGKTFLLRALWHRAPRGFAPIFAPCADARADEIAARILATTRSQPVRDPAGGLARSLRARALRGARPLLLVDDLDRVAPDALAELLAIAHDSRVDVALVAAGREGPALDLLLGLDLLPRTLRSVTIDAPWRLADAKRLLAGLADALPGDADAWLAAIDLEAALRSANGNPRALRSALASQLRELDFGRSSVESAISAPEPVTPAICSERAASSEPAEAPPPIDPPPPEATPPRGASRARARRSPRMALAALVGALAIGSGGAVVLAWGSQHGGDLAAWSRATAIGYASDAHDRIVAWQPPRIPIARIAADASALVSDRVRRISEWELPELPQLELPELPDLPEVPDLPALPDLPELPALPSFSEWLPATFKPDPPAPPPPPIRVAVNSHPWSNVAIDGVAAGATPLVVELAPGSHHFRAELADGSVVERQLDVTEQNTRVVLQ